LEAAASTMPVVAVMGARQTGKTTLVRSQPWLSTYHYLTLDDLSVRLAAQEDPESLVARSPRMILDEVQRAKDLLIAVKRAVDSDPVRTPGRFILTGSANLLMLERLGETLAGRAAYVTLWPFTRRERLGTGQTGPWSELLAAPFRDWRDVILHHASPQEDWEIAVRTGGFPVPALDLHDHQARATWFTGYVQTYLERDLQALRAVEQLSDLRRLMRAASLRIGSLLNQTDLARDVGTSQPQVHRFLNLLEASFLVVRLPAYSLNRTRRLIKAPKIYWCDPAMALHLSGEPSPRGEHLENLVLLDLLAWRDSQVPPPDILYWRTASGHEVDFVVEAPARLLPVEVKASGRVSPSDARSLRAFLEEYPDLADGGLLLYAGRETFVLARGVLAAPWWAVC
jgi:predicted AAA+ superfamily ATPase